MKPKRRRSPNHTRNIPTTSFTVDEDLLAWIRAEAPRRVMSASALISYSVRREKERTERARHG